MESNYLIHYGIKGQKWGIRRYQNPDGSLTSAGRKRYSDSGGIRSAVSKVKNAVTRRGSSSKAAAKSKQAEKEEKEKETLEQKKERVLKSRSAKELYENADLFTTQELQSAYNRLSLERNISSLVPKDVNKGKQFVDSTLKTAKTINDAIDTGSKLYNNVAKVYNSLTEEGRKKPLPMIKDDQKKDKDKKDDD